MAGKTSKAVIQFVILLSVGILLIWLSLRQVAPEKDKIIYAFKNADYLWVGISILIAFLSHFLRAWRWNYLLNPLGYAVKPINSTCHVLVGYLANYGIPRMGEVTRCTLAAKYDKVPFEVGFGTVITERIVDFFIFLIISVLTLTLQFSELSGLANTYIFDKIKNKVAAYSNSPEKLIVPLGILVLLISMIWLFRKKLAKLMRGKAGNILKGMGEGIGSIRKTKSPVRFVLLSLMIWAAYFYSLYSCFFALNGTSHLGQKECLTLILFGTFGVILAPGGLGAYPAILFSILFYTYNVDKASAFALPWLSWTAQFVLIVITGMAALVLLPVINKPRDGVKAEHTIQQNS
jgi:glycosyltransferase 2 family protein